MNFRSCFTLGASLALVAAMVSTSAAQAQNREGRGGRGFLGMQNGAKLYLVQAKPVQEELKITPEQQSKLEPISQSYREELRALMPFGQGVSREEAREKFEQNRDKIAKLGQETEKKIDELLNDDQKKRLDEISLQSAGVDALRREEVAAKLKLTAEQKQKIETLLDLQADKRREAFSEGGGGRDAIAKLREETDTKVTSVLNEEQKTQWKEMQGKEFDLASLRQPRRQQ